MNILMVAHFTTMPEEAGNNRFNYLAERLSEKGHKVTLVTTSFSHNAKTQRLNKNIMASGGYDIELCYEPGYKKNISLKRFYSHYIWGNNVKKCLKRRRKPDVIYCAVPSLTAPLAIVKYCKENDIRCIIDIQDLWPEAFQMVLNIPIIKHFLFAPFKWMADRIYKNADEIVAVSQTYVNRALQVNKKCKRGHAVFLGTELKKFDENSKKNKVLKKPKEEIWLGYCGTLGKSYDLTCVIDAMDILKRDNLKLIVMGDGPQRNKFEEYAIRKKASVLFTGRLPYEDMCGLLKECDIMVNPIIGTSVASIINKHADYVATGRPIINTQQSPEFIKLIEEYEMGYSVSSGNSAEFAEVVNKLADNPDLRNRMGSGSRKCAEELFDREKTYSELIKIIEDYSVEKY